MLFLSDGNGEFTKTIGLDFDGSGIGLGTRSKRYAMLVDDGVVKVLNVEDSPGVADVSSTCSPCKRPPREQACVSSSSCSRRARRSSHEERSPVHSACAALGEERRHALARKLVGALVLVMAVHGP